MKALTPHPSTPELFLGWCECLLGLGVRDAAAWWQALGRATSPAAATLRHTVLFHATQRPRFAELMGLSREVLTPEALVQSLEACVADGTLSRWDATRIEECIFARMHQGAWRGDRKVLGEVKGTAP